MSRVVSVVWVLAWLLVSAGCAGAPTSSPTPTTSAPGPTDIPPPDVTRRPFGLSETLIERLRDRQFKEAYELLGEGARGQVSLYTFEAEARWWTEDRTRYKELATARVLSEILRGDKARTLVGDPGALQDTYWTLYWEKNLNGEWKLRSAEGGPFGEPELDKEELPTF